MVGRGLVVNSKGKVIRRPKKKPPPFAQKRFLHVFIYLRPPSPPLLSKLGEGGGGGPDSSVSSCLYTYAMLSCCSFFLAGKGVGTTKRKVITNGSHD